MRMESWSISNVQFLLLYDQQENRHVFEEKKKKTQDQKQPDNKHELHLKFTVTAGSFLHQRTTYM